MAKKKGSRVVATRGKPPQSTVVDLPVGKGEGLSTYQSHIVTPNFTLFFEIPSKELILTTPAPHFGAKKATGKHKGFTLLSDGCELIGDVFARQIAQLFINYLGSKTISSGTFKDLYRGVSYFVTFMAENHKECKRVEDLNLLILSSSVRNHPALSYCVRVKKFLKTVISRHPFIKTMGWNLDNLRYPKFDDEDITTESFDSLVDENYYSDKETCQLLSYCIFEIESIKKRFDAMNALTAESLGDNFVCAGAPKKGRAWKKIVELYHNKNYEAICQNMLLEEQYERAGKPLELGFDRKISNQLRMVKQKKVEGRDYFKEYQDFLEYIYQNHLASRSAKWGVAFRFGGVTPTFLVLLYAMFATGKNGESLLSIKRNYDGVPWYEHYDKYLGVDDETPQSQKAVRLVGAKFKGTIVKPIAIRVPLNSTLFTYLKLIDDILDAPERERFFGDLSASSFYSYSKHSFLVTWPVFSDDGARMKAIEMTKIRKTYAGNLVMRAIDEATDGESLVSIMTSALNHGSFDTTFTSYIMRTGSATHVIDTAIVALTNDMLNRAIHFQGQICEDSEKKETSKEVFLCDCVDNTKPTHDIPIAKKCQKYDLCLGCERSEVYAHHVKNIWYRAMQYDAISAENPLAFNGLLADRRQIAHDTIERFRCDHPDGEWIADSAFEDATRAFANGDLLVPPITQFQ